MDKTTINPSEIGKQLAIPQIKVIEDGKEVVRPDVLQAVVQLATLGQLTRIRRSLEKEEFEGIKDDRKLSATDQLQWIDLINYHPNVPWVTAFFFNDGDISTDPPGKVTVYIAINDTYSPSEIKKGESLNLDFLKADRRIEEIYYWCDTGETASVRVIGKY